VVCGNEHTAIGMVQLAAAQENSEKKHFFCKQRIKYTCTKGTNKTNKFITHDKENMGNVKEIKGVQKVWRHARRLKGGASGTGNREQVIQIE
jgi:hypothetical protein